MEAITERITQQEAALRTLSEQWSAKIGTVESSQAAIAGAQTTLEEDLNRLKVKLNEEITQDRAGIAELKELISSAIKEDRLRLDRLESSSGNSNRQDAGKAMKPVLESKAVGDCPKLGNDRSEYKSWKERLSNALEAVRPGMKKLLEVMATKTISEGIPYTEEGKFDFDTWAEWNE